VTVLCVALSRDVVHGAVMRVFVGHTAPISKVFSLSHTHTLSLTHSYTHTHTHTHTHTRPPSQVFLLNDPDEAEDDEDNAPKRSRITGNVKSTPHPTPYTPNASNSEPYTLNSTPPTYTPTQETDHRQRQVHFLRPERARNEGSTRSKRLDDTGTSCRRRRTGQSGCGTLPRASTSAFPAPGRSLLRHAQA